MLGSLSHVLTKKSIPLPKFSNNVIKGLLLEHRPKLFTQKGSNYIYNFSKQDPDEIILKYHANEHSFSTSNIIVTEMCRVEGGGGEPSNILARRGTAAPPCPLFLICGLY